MIVLRGTVRKDDGSALLTELDDLLEAQDAVPWTDDSREADRELIGGRHA